jgi:CheY-like chemotaxis protein
VLVIEDNADAAAALGSALSLMGHEVRAVGDGESGIQVARAFAPEVVICDLGLPGMTGYAVAAAFRADSGLCETCLIALSGYARPEDRRRAIEAGFDHHVAKPADPELFGRLISEASRPGAAPEPPSSPCPRPAATAFDRAAASAAGSRPAAYASRPSRRSSAADRLVRRGSAAG